MPSILLDTSLISGVVNAEMNSSDRDAFNELVGRAQRGLLTIHTSTVTREEIDRIPLAYRSSHVEEYETLSLIRGSETSWVEMNAHSPSPGSNVEHPDFKALKEILKDENDARLVFQAKMANIPAFVTLDVKTIMSKAAAIANVSGVQVFSPSQYLTSTLKSA